MFIKHANKYLKQGFSVFPALSNKKPAIPTWTPYQTRMPMPEEIDGWSKDLNDPNIAIVCGKISDLTVVDADSCVAIKEIEALLPDQCKVPIVHTPRGGLHYYFKYCPNLKSRNAARPKIDIKSKGGYVLAPPSRTERGFYKWHESLNLNTTERPAVPPELLAYLIDVSARSGTPSASPEQPILVQGTRDQDLYHLALQFLKDKRPLEEIRTNLLNVAAICKPPQSEKEALAKIDSAFRTYMKSGGKRGYHEDADLIDEDQTTTLDCRPVSSFKCRLIEYLMQDRIPYGMVTLLVGAGGTGKSTLLTEIASRVSKGELLPGSNKVLADGSTIYITTENQPEEVLKPRVLACGGDTNKIHYVRNALAPTIDKPGQPHVFDIAKHLPALKKMVAKIGNVRLVVIDPVISHISEKIDPNSSTHVRHVMDALSAVAEELKIAIIVVAHMAKGIAQQAMYKVAGSHQWVAAARVVQAVSLAKEDHELRLLSPMKANVFITSFTLGFKIITTTIQTEDLPGVDLRTARVEFEERELDIDVEDHFAPENQKTSQTSQAMLILRQELHNGPKPEQAVHDAVTAKGINRGSYHDARRHLKIHTEKTGKVSGWALWLPEHWEAYLANKK